MIPTVSAPLPVTKGPQPVTNQPAQARPEAAPQGASKSTSGEAASANVRVETRAAIDPTRQSTVSPRLREQENAERAERRTGEKEGPAGPPPAFEETLLQRQARVAFQPAETPPPVLEPIDPETQPEEAPKTEPAERTPEEGNARPEPRETVPPNQDAARRVEAEQAFSQTRAVAEAPSQPVVDVAR